MNLPLVSFRYTYRFLADGAVVTSDSTLRFRGLDELESSLAAQGYHVLDVREAPDHPRPRVRVHRPARHLNARKLRR